MKSVHFASPRKNIYYTDKYSFEERSELCSTKKELQRYKRDAKELIGIFRAHESTFSSLDSNKYYVRGLEALCNDEAIIMKKKFRECYKKCIFELQDAFHIIEDGGSGMDPKRQEKLICAIDKLASREIKRALERASQDRFAADEIYEDDKRCRQIILDAYKGSEVNTGVDRFSLAQEPLPRLQSAITA